METTYQDIFKRRERKYMLDEEQFALMGELLSLRMEKDKYGVYTICNIYFDTEIYSLINRSMEKPAYKEKLRLRSYGEADDDSRVFLEIKKKFKGVVYKRRIALPLKDAEAWIYEGKRPAVSGQTAKELEYFLNSHVLTNKTFLAYDRTAFAEKGGGSLRVTFDSNIRARKENPDLRKDGGDLCFDKNYHIMEVKAQDAMPLWLAHAINENGIYPVSFSKYGYIYKQYLHNVMEYMEEEND